MGDKLHASSAMMWAVIAMIFISSYLLVAELPLFALKFKHWGWKGNEVKYIFVLTSALMIIAPVAMGMGVIGIAATIAWYVLLSVVTNKRN